ncbi:hypothetical protein ACSBR2_033128 [Camellia fascicularis]
MGVEKARSVVFGDYSSSFDDLRWYVDATNYANLGSVFDMKFDVDSKGRHFKRLFFAFEACIHGFKYCWPTLILDGTFLKGRQQKTVTNVYFVSFVIIFKTMIILSFLLLESVEYELLVILTSMRDTAFVINRHRGLLKALTDVFSFSSNSFCLMHLKTNLKTYLSVKSRESKKYLLTLFSGCVYAPIIELFNELFEEFQGRCGRSVQKLFKDLPNEF